MFKFQKTLIGAGVSVVLFAASSAFSFAATGTGVVSTDILNIRRSPSTSAEIIEQLEKGAKVPILSNSDGWCKVTYNGITGYVNSGYLTVKQVASSTAKIIAEDVNLRQEPTTDALILDTYDVGTSLSVISSSGDWFKVRMSDGKVGWMFRGLFSGGSNTTESTKTAPVVKKPSASKSNRSGDQVRQTEAAPKVQNEDIDNPNEPKGIDKADVDESSSDSRQQIVAYAKKFLGVRYVYGGNTPSGFDCSGYVKYVMSHFGINLERVASSQACQGKRVSRSELMPGDLVFFDTNGGGNYINHAGMYIGNGLFIHASSGRSNRRVVISDLSSGFYSSAYMTGRRVLN